MRDSFFREGFYPSFKWLATAAFAIAFSVALTISLAVAFSISFATCGATAFPIAGFSFCAVRGAFVVGP